LLFDLYCYPFAESLIMIDPPVMPPGMTAIYEEMVDNLRNPEELPANGLARLGECIQIVRGAIDKIKCMVLQEEFPDPQSEIFFFKEIKPFFSAHLLFYRGLYRLEILRPLSASGIQEEYFQELRKLCQFRGNDQEFYQYYRGGFTHLDAVYFLRGNHALHLRLNDFVLEADPRFSTGYDYAVARILASQLFSDHLAICLAKSSDGRPSVAAASQEFTWTAQKVGLAELLYAFQASGVLNNSRTATKKMAEYFSRVFNVQLGNVYKIFEEIRLRKKNRTVFLDSLRQNLLRKMDEDDEHAL